MRPRSKTVVAAAFLWKATVQHGVGIKNDGFKELSVGRGRQLLGSRGRGRDNTAVYHPS